MKVNGSKGPPKERQKRQDRRGEGDDDGIFPFVEPFLGNRFMADQKSIKIPV